MTEEAPSSGSSWTDRFSLDAETTKNLQTGDLVAAIAALVYCVYQRRQGAERQGPRRKYGALGNRDPDADSDGDEADDPRERRRMLELSSFGPGEGAASGAGAYLRGRKQGNAAPAAGTSSAGGGASSFPLASFAMSAAPQADGGASGQSSGAPRRGQASGAAADADEDAAGDELQRELELFAQDDDGEEQALMDNTGAAGG